MRIIAILMIAIVLSTMLAFASRDKWNQRSYRGIWSALEDLKEKIIEHQEQKFVLREEYEEKIEYLEDKIDNLEDRIDEVEACGCSSGTEECNGLDDDKDGAIDEDLPILVSECGVGQCLRTGIEVCKDGDYVDTCQPGIPSTEICNGLDDDCDGIVDEEIPPETTTCGAGACTGTGQRSCVNGQLVDDCMPTSGQPEQCNNIDDDCDGSIDEGIQTISITCGIGECLMPGTRTCTNGQMVDSCVPGLASSETCDGLDNDCDGQADEGLPVTQTECGEEACATTGEYRCQDGTWIDTCIPLEPQPETCNGIDDNCDGEIDNDFGEYDCELQQGVCSGSSEICDSDLQYSYCDEDVYLAHSPDYEPVETRCDDLDNDCDGYTDEDLLGNNEHCGYCYDECFDGTECCGLTCAEIESDQDNCGGCGIICEEGYACEDGFCVEEMI